MFFSLCRDEIHVVSTKRLSGFSLLEFLIAMTLGIFLLSAIINFFSYVKKTHYTQSELTILHSNGLFALDLIRRDIQKAGFLGCSSRWSHKKLLNTVKNPHPFFQNFKQIIHGNENIAKNQWFPPLDVSLKKVLPADVLTLRYANQQSFSVIKHDSKDAPVTIKYTTTLNKNDVVIIADCEAGSIFKISQISRRKSQGKAILYHNDTVNRQTDLYKNYPKYSRLMSVHSVSYFIRKNSNKQPALYRIENNGVAREMIAGIENMQIHYGVDLNLDNQLDAYLTADKVENRKLWSKITTIQLSLLARSLNNHVTIKKQNYTYDNVAIMSQDHYFRKVITANISIRNQLP